MSALLEADGLRVAYDGSDVVQGVTFSVPEGPFGTGLIGESGSGKTTIARALLRLLPPSGGVVRFEGRDIASLRGQELREFRRSVQIVLQDGSEALNPRMRAGASVAEALAVHGIVPRSARAQRVAELLGEVGLDGSFAGRFPHELSGGQRQRVAIARALAVEPRLIVLDEPTSALDVTVQARILELIERLRVQRKLAYVLISHNLAVVDRLCDECVVLQDGRVVERGVTAEVLGNPQAEHTRALRAAVPDLPRVAT